MKTLIVTVIVVFLCIFQFHKAESVAPASLDQLNIWSMCDYYSGKTCGSYIRIELKLYYCIHSRV